MSFRALNLLSTSAAFWASRVRASAALAAFSSRSAPEFAASVIKESFDAYEASVSSLNREASSQVSCLSDSNWHISVEDMCLSATCALS